MGKRGLLALLLPLAVLIGCTMPSGGSYSDIYRGTEGLAFGFLKDYPPEKVFEGSKLILALELENKGTADIVRGMLAVSLEEDYLKLRSWEDQRDKRTGEASTFNLKGRSSTNPAGEKKIMTANLDALILERQTETHTSNLLVTACYVYKTHFEDNVCIDTSVFDVSQKIKSCEDADRSFSGEGAPVAVTKRTLKVVPHPERSKVIPFFTLEIDNVGQGEIVSTQSIAKACSSSPMSKEDINRISVEATLGGQSLDCTPKDFYLSQNRRSMICELKGGVTKQLGSYVSALVVDLSYGYTETMSRQVEVRRITP